MKFLLPLFLLFAIYCPAQMASTSISSTDSKLEPTEWRKRKPVSKGFLEVQGGLLYAPNKAKDYFGVNYFNFGLGRKSEKEMRGIEVDLIRFQQDSEPYYVDNGTNELVTILGEDFGRKKFAIDVTAYRAFKINNADEFGIYIGPALALGISTDEIIPNISNSFSTTDKDLRLGIGGKLNIQIPLSKKLWLSTGTKLFLVDASYHTDFVNNPGIPIQNQSTNSFQFKFLRPQFYLPIGLTFSL